MCVSFTAREDYTGNGVERKRGSNASSESGSYLAQAKQTDVIDKDSSIQVVHMQSALCHCYLSGLNVYKIIS